MNSPDAESRFAASGSSVNKALAVATELAAGRHTARQLATGQTYYTAGAKRLRLLSVAVPLRGRQRPANFEGSNALLRVLFTRSYPRFYFHYRRQVESG
jgi:hypothetical protein